MGSDYFRSNKSAQNSIQDTQNRIIDLTLSDNSGQEVQKISSEEICLERRFSPRLKNIPKDKRPFYGSEHRRRSSASKNVAAGEIVSQHSSKITPDGLLSERRFSPRLKNISPDKRPYYGSLGRQWRHASKNGLHDKINDDNNQKRQLDSPKCNADKGNAKAGIAEIKKIAQQVSKMTPDRSFLAGAVSPLLRGVLGKRPNNYSCQNRELDANKHYHDDKDDLMSHSPNNDVSEHITKLNHSIQDCLHMAIESACDRDTESDSVLDFAPNEHQNESIMNVEDGACLAQAGCETFLADDKHHGLDQTVREMVVGLKAFSSFTYKGCHYSTLSFQETANEVLDIPLRKKLMEQFQKAQSNALLLERRISQRLKSAARPYYGSHPKRRLNATKNSAICKNDQEQHLCSPKDRGANGKAGADFMMLKCQLNVARKDTMDIPYEGLLDSDFRSDKYGSTEIVDSENGAYLKLVGCKRLVADQVCRRTRARMKQMDSAKKERESKGSSALLGLVCEDISIGQEDLPIPVTNTIDPPLAPTGFKYIKSIRVARNVVVPKSPSGCNCKGDCTNPKTCSCARLNGPSFPYVHKDCGRLIEPKDVVFECGPGCGCGPNCINRVSQQGIKYQLEVYRTKKKGWAVRSWDFIPSGAPVCEYIGVLKRCADLENVSENDYIFEIDCWHTMHGLGGRERRQGDVSKHARHLVEKMEEGESETEFCIDGASYSNVTRFINHSCDPNLFVQCVLSSHHDVRFARIVLFAADDIPPMQELSYDYGYALDSVTYPDGRIKKLTCYCGTSECRGRLY